MVFFRSGHLHFQFFISNTNANVESSISSEDNIEENFGDGVWISGTNKHISSIKNVGEINMNV